MAWDRVNHAWVILPGWAFGGGGGGLGSVTAQNGLSNLTSSTVELGGALIKNTTITGAYNFILSGQTSFKVTTTDSIAFSAPKFTFRDGNVLIGTPIDDGHQLRVNGLVSFGGSDGSIWYTDADGTLTEVLEPTGMTKPILGYNPFLHKPIWEEDSLGTGGGGGTPGGSNLQLQYNNSGAFAGSSLYTVDITNKHLVIAGAGNVGLELTDNTGGTDRKAFIEASNYGWRFRNNFGGNGIVAMNTSGSFDVTIDNEAAGAILFRPGTVQQFKLAVNGEVTFNHYASGTTAPTTSGTKHMLTVDVNGLVSHEAIPGGGSSYTFSTPLSETGGTVSIANAAADGSTKGAASFTAADFNATSGNISIDYTNGQLATSGQNGFLSSTDWSTFNGKAPASGSANYIQNTTSVQSSSNFNISGTGIMVKGLFNTTDGGGSTYAIELSGHFWQKSGTSFLNNASIAGSFTHTRTSGDLGTSFVANSSTGTANVIVQAGNAAASSNAAYFQFVNNDARRNGGT
jgi:hypothetical protein